MTRLERNVNITAVLLPFLVVVAAVPLLWGRLIGPSDVVVFAVMYVACGLGVTVGFHRMLTHRDGSRLGSGVVQPCTSSLGDGETTGEDACPHAPAAVHRPAHEPERQLAQPDSAGPDGGVDDGHGLGGAAADVQAPSRGPAALPEGAPAGV